jgi:hypothetical protein
MFNFSFLFCFLFYSINYSYASTDNIGDVHEEDLSTTTPFMPFKIGFEFQEINGLCPWALDDNNIQKKTYL